MLLSGLLSLLLWFPAVEHPVLARAVGSLGTPYRFGGTTEKGFDCAGFVRYAYAPLGVDLPRTSASQYLVGEPVEREELQSGDLVFFRNTYRAGISHVGIYVGNGRFVHAASTSKDVRIDRLDSPYYAKRFAGGRRVGTLVSAMKH